MEWTTDFKEGLIPAVNWSYYANPEHASQLAELAKLNKTPGIWRTHTSHVLKVWKRNFDWSVLSPPPS